VRIASVACACAIAIAPAVASAAITDCIEDAADGTMACTAPTLGSEQINACAETGAFPQIDQAVAKCYTPPARTDAAIIAAGNCFAAAMTGCPASLQHAEWTGWSVPGQNYFSNNCWSVTTTRQNGIDTNNWGNVVGTAMRKDAQGNCTVPSSWPVKLEIWRPRGLVCPKAYSKSTRSNGDIVCKRAIGTPCPDCGDPIEVGTGRFTESETDYVSPELTFVRGYDRFGSFRPNSAPVQVPKPLGEYWTHNFEARVYEYPSNPYVMAAVLRPNGAILFFDATGHEKLNSRSNAVLERLTDGGAPAGWRYRPDDTQSEEYDAGGALVAISRPGVKLTLAYSDASTPLDVAPAPGLLVSVTDEAGRSLAFTYDIFGHLTKMIDPAGQPYRYETGAALGPAVTLTKVTYPDGGVRTYVYGETANTSGTSQPDALTGVIDENGERYSTIKYTSTSAAFETSHALGADKTTITAIDVANKSVTNALGYVEKYTFQTTPVVRNTLVTRPCIGAGCSGTTQLSMTYDANGNLASRTDWNGNVTTFQYDMTRNLETQRIEAVGKAEQRTISTEWHPTLPVPVRTAEPLRITTFVYNGEGATCGTLDDGTTPVPDVVCTKTVQPTSDATGAAGFSASAAGTPRTWSFSYDAAGKLTAIDGPRTDVDDRTTFAYYADDDADPAKRRNLASVTNALGHVFAITAYDVHGAPTAMIDPNGVVVTTTFDARHRTTARTVGALATTYDYDAAGNLLELLLPDGADFSFRYDIAHRLVGMSDNEGNTIAYTLDAMGHRTLEQVRDASSQILQSRARAYDGLGRIAKLTGAQGQATLFVYDGNGNVVQRTDPLGHTLSYAYDALDRMIGVNLPGSVSYAFAYDALGHVVKVTQPRGLETTYAYSAFGELLEEHGPEAGTRTITYDEAGNATTVSDAKGQVTTYAYDALNRPTTIHYADGSDSTFTYDQGAHGIGHLSTVSDAAGATSYAYDALGRITEETVTRPSTQATLSLTVTYAYDATGHLASITYPSGRKLDYAYDGAGRVSRVQTSSGGATTTLADLIAYRPFGDFTSFVPATSSPVARTFDTDGRIASYSAAGKTWNLTYDDASRVTAIADAANALDARTFAYDDLGRLVQAVTPAGSESMTYDASGNRLTRSAGTSTQMSTYAADSNRILSTTLPVARTYTYDANGSPLSDGTNQFTYDARGRLIGVTSAAATATYAIDTFGRRTAKRVQ
jgi:YD repeat-containing protein